MGVQEDMLKVLSDGLPHSREELHRCCLPSGLKSVRDNMSRIRARLRPIGQDIICELVHRKICYRHVRLLCSADE